MVLDYLFIFPLDMGIFGAVFATGLSPLIGILFLLPHWLRPSRGFHLVSPGPVLRPAASSLSLGIPSLLAQLSSGVVMIAFNRIILGLTGNIGVAAYGVVANLSLVISSVYTGIAQGIQPLASREHGQGQRQQAERLLAYGLASMALLSLALYGVIFCFAGPIAHVFNSQNSQTLQQIAAQGLRLYFLAAPFMGANIILSMWFSSVEQALPAQVISLLRGLVLVLPLAFALAAQGGMTGVWLAVPLTECLTALAGALFYGRRPRAVKTQGGC